MKYLITYTPDLRKAVLAELRSIDKFISVLDDFDEYIMMIETNMSDETFIILLKEKDPIFIKHIMPVNKISKLNNSTNTDDDILTEIYQSILGITSLKKDQKFSVQARMHKNSYSINSKDIEVYVGTNIEKDFSSVPYFSDYTLLNNDDIVVISIMIKESTLYLGISLSKNNLNFHSNEYRIFSRDGGRSVSRAENKLKEAITKFNISLKGGLAMDIGAAPGGWTKVLVDNGFYVHSIDPGNLIDSLKSNPRVTHFKGKVQDFEIKDKYDLIVNDMNVYPDVSTDIINKVHPYLKEKGNIIFTLKFIDPRIDRTILQTNNALSVNYKIIRIKNLFHNRKEITYLLEKK